MIIVHTENSTYEIDQTAKLVRRSEGDAAPTPRFQKDGVWRPYKSMTTPVVGEPIEFIWDDGGQTITSWVTLWAVNS